jgi:hypothetical protein
VEAVYHSLADYCTASPGSKHGATAVKTPKCGQFVGYVAKITVIFGNLNPKWGDDAEVQDVTGLLQFNI